MRRFEQVPHDLSTDLRLSIGARALYPLLRRLAWDAGRREPEDAVQLPTVVEIAGTFGVAESTTRTYVAELRRNGWVETVRASRRQASLWVIRDDPRAPKSGVLTGFESAEIHRPSPPKSGGHSSYTDVDIQPLAADAAEEVVSTRHDLMVALGRALAIDLAGRASRERRQWELACDDLLEVGASPADVVARVEAWPWPGTPTPLAIVGHWAHLGTLVETKQASGFASWLALAPTRFDIATAHELVDDMPCGDGQERAERHLAVDERYDQPTIEGSKAA